jgi:hypothetical protein
MGGLGNQLFQIFATIATGIRDGHKIIFPYVESTNYGTVIRYTFWNSFLAPIQSFTNINNRDESNSNKTLMELPQYEYFFHNYTSIPTIAYNQNIRLFGYFQSYKFFIDYQDIIFKLIKLNEQIESVKNEYSHLFAEDVYTISMHFRLGDYKYIQNCHNILPYEYYEKSLIHVTNRMVNKSQPIRVLYFCENEDNEWVFSIIDRLKLLYLANPIEYVKVDDTIVDWKQMLLMSACRANIIANSTFSWWGAYFNRVYDKTVCYPAEWFGPALNHNYMGDMFPEDWTCICI